MDKTKVPAKEIFRIIVLIILAGLSVIISLTVGFPLYYFFSGLFIGALLMYFLSPKAKKK